MVPPLYSFAHNCFPSSPSENPVINQSLLILPPLLYWRESIFYSPPFVLFWRQLPPPPKSSDPSPQSDKLWQLPYPYAYVTQRSSSESNENDETVEDPPPDRVHYPAAINEDSKRSKYKDGDLIISYNMFSFPSIWQERGRVITVTTLKIRDGHWGCHSKDGDLIISYNMFSFPSIWQERGRVITVTTLKIRDGNWG